MGWKNLKEGYKILHTVCVRKEGIAVGSAYIPDLIVVGLDGKLKKNDRECANEDLRRVLAEMQADPGKLMRLVSTPDTFTTDIVVYTFENGQIVEKLCEKLGWPNVTHDGKMMYENSFSTDKSVVIAWAKRNSNARVELHRERLAEMECDLEKRKAILAAAIDERDDIELAYPDVSADTD